MEARQEERRRGYKKTIDVDEARRKREDQTVSIRKVRREENIMKKRRELLAAPSATAASASAGASDLGFESGSPELREALIAHRDAMASEDVEAVLAALKEVRKLLSMQQSPPIDAVIEMGFVTPMVAMLRRDDYPVLQFEAAWALTNIASGSSHQTIAVLEGGAVPPLVQLLSSPHDHVVEQAIWALGNIAGESARCRNFILGQGIMSPLLGKLSLAASWDQSADPLAFLRNATWALSNLCRGKPPPPFDIVKVALPSLAHLLYISDEDVLVDSAWALSYLSDGTSEQIQAVIECGVTRRIVELLLHDSVRLQTPCLRTVGNLVTGDDLQTQVVINSSVLPCLLRLLSSPKKSICKEACWTISNITAGNKQQIQAVLDAELMEPVIRLLTHAEFDIKKEAVWAVSNVASGGNPAQIMQLVSLGCLAPLCQLFDAADTRSINVALEGVENILKAAAEERNGLSLEDIVFQVEDCGGVDKLEALQLHENEAVYQKAVKILDQYFDACDKEPLEAVAPATNSDNTQYEFGSGAGNGLQASPTYPQASGFNFNFSQEQQR